MCIVYSLNPSLYCTGQAGHGRANFLGKDDNWDSTLTIYMNCLSMDVAYNPRLKKYNPRYCTETDKGFTFWLDLSVPVLCIRIRIRIGSVFRSFLDPDPDPDPHMQNRIK